MPASILIVDDDRNVAKLLKEGLALDSHSSVHALNGAQAKSILEKGGIDLIVLDFNLPDTNGIELLRELRSNAKTAAIPVIMLTVKGEEIHKVKGLDAGADDYLVKPVSIPELLARVNALMRRLGSAAQPPAGLLEAGSIKVDLAQREAWLKGKRLDLTLTEWSVLATLIARRGMVFTYAALADSITTTKEITSQTLYSHVTNLRKKLGSEGRLIETVHGVGYKFAP